MIENVPLFDIFSPESATSKQLLDALNHAIDPNTGQSTDYDQDMYHELKYMWRKEETPVGTFERVTEWNGGDQRPMGIVIKHLESGRLFMAEGTYSSWDGSSFDDWVEAEPYDFVETRYRAK